MHEPPPPGPMRAHLEHYPEPGGPVELVPITKDPFIIGRSRSAHLAICSQKVSKQHAAISRADGGYLIRDLGSMNGTFVNGKRIDEVLLLDGDIIHIAHWEYCFCLNSCNAIRQYHTTRMTQLAEVQERESLIRVNGFLQQMIVEGSVNVLFQPIVDLRTRAPIGFEALGRGGHHRLSQSPLKLFEHAERCDMAKDLCRLFRTRALKESTTLPSQHRLFLNIHQSELAKSDFIECLAHLTRTSRLHQQLVIEISEQWVTDVPRIRVIQRQLEELGIEFAYDDFGSGQARLLALVECPPHFLKLDRGLIQGIESSEACQEIVRALLRAIDGKGIRVIAEGIETEPVAVRCLELGCHLGQGFLFGRPKPIGEIFRGQG